MRRRWLWIGFDLGLAILALIVLGTTIWRWTTSDASAAALRFLGGQPRVRELIGDDMRTGWTSGTVGPESARLTLPLKGSAGAGTARVELEKRSDGQWEVVAASCEKRDGSVMELLARPAPRPPSPGREHLDRAYELYRAQKWSESLVHFDAALGLDPGNAEATYFRGAARAKSGALDLALADFVRVMELDPDRINAYRYADWILAQRQDWDGIIAHWSRYLEGHPDSGEAWCERAGARKQRGDRDAALADARRSCELGWAFCCAYVRRTQAAP